MNCHEFASLLDEQGFRILAAPLPDETRDAVQAHAERCDDCRAVLAAADALRLDSVPELGPIPLLGLVGSIDANRGARPRRAAAALGLLLVGGAVFAAIGVVGWSYLADGGDDDSAATAVTEPGGDPGDGQAVAGVPADAAFASAAPLVEYLEAAERRAHEDFTATLLGAMPDGEYFALMRRPPAYPEAAAERGLEGYVIVEFTITETGDVTDVQAIDSSDPVFEASAIESALKAKYRPRVTGGVPVAVRGVRNRFRFALEQPAAATAGEAGADASGDATERGADEGTGTGSATAAADEPRLDWAAFGGLLGPLLECLDRNDLRCAELELDVLLARADPAPQQEAYLNHIYGFIYHRRGRYELAIESYEKAAGATGDGAFLRPQQLQTLAQIYYERDRYQDALDTMLEFVRVSPGVTAAHYVFMDRLRELGARDR